MKLFQTYGMCCNLHTYHFECMLPLLLDYIMRGIMRIVFLLLCLIVFLDFCVGLILCQSSLFHNTCFSQENQLKHIIFPPYRQTMYYTSHTPILASIILNQSKLFSIKFLICRDCFRYLLLLFQLELQQKQLACTAHSTYTKPCSSGATSPVTH